MKTNTILFSDKLTLEIVLNEAQRVALLGGKFEVKQYYSGNWMVDITIWYPNDEQ